MLPVNLVLFCFMTPFSPKQTTLLHFLLSLTRLLALHTEASSTLGIQSLADRRSELCRTLFTQVVNNESHSLHYLLPVKRDSQLIGRLRSATAYPTFRVRTIRFKNSFLPFCLSNYQ